ncbi:RidA family protein [Falsiroseomonas ponticola]|uniref:RidA family protein n=1 Tax=Falsiroseomonas ponticola TaxID=2786951 RepID=UPI00193187A0|nr:RidA family protein [Roseomonas ponticola]
MIERIDRTPIMHRVVRHQDTLYLSGIIAADLAAPMAGQTRQVLERLEALLARHGSGRSKVLAATIYLSDMTQKAAMNEVWISWFAAEDLPARATIGVADLGPGVLIEVVATAVC